MQKIAALLSSSLLCTSVVFCASTWEEGSLSLLADFVYLEQYEPSSASLAIDTYDGVSHEVMDTKKLSSGFSYGVRGSIEYRPDPKNMYAASGIYLWPLEETREKKPIGTLSFPFSDPDFAESYTAVSSLQEKYRLEFYTAELNYLRTFSETRHGYLALFGLFGLRFAEVSEKLLITAYKGRGSSNYNISAQNSLIGVQTGLSFEIHPSRRFYWQLVAKAGVDLNRIDAKVYLGNLNNTERLRDYTKNKGKAGVFAEVDAGVGCQILRYLNLHAGYKMLFFGGLAMAKDQLDYSSSQMPSSQILSSYNVSDNGYILLHGIYAGMTFSF